MFAVAGDSCPDDGTPLVAAPEGADPIVGMLLAGRYRVIKRLGEGGMGEVYLATHEAIEKRVALKILKHEYSEKPEVVARFQQEAKSASRIKHPNIVDVSDFGQIADGRFFLALEYLEGQDLARQLGKQRLMETPRVLGIVLQICSALGAAHARGVVHRDLKPENVFLQVDGNGDDAVKIVDFGIAKMREIGEATPLLSELEGRRLTKAGTIFGTPEYMAPEQASGRDVDPRADIYAVGILLYEMFTGRVPFTGDSLVHTLTMHVTDAPPPMRQSNPALAISPALERVVMQAIEKAPADRFPSMAALADGILATPEGRDLGRPSGARGRPSTPAPPSPVTFRAPAAMESEPPIPLVSRARTVERMDARAATIAEMEVPAGRSRKGLFMAVCVSALALGAVGVVAVTRLRTDRALPTSAVTPVSASAPVVVAEPPAPSPLPSAAPAQVSAQNGIVLHVVTEPSGAVLKKGGFQVCDATPCDVLTAANEAVEITGEKADLRGSAKVLPQRAQTVVIKLARVAGGATTAVPKASANVGAGGGRNVAPIPMCEVQEGDLKILRPCR